MALPRNYKLGLLNLMYLLINSDGDISEKELSFLDEIKNREEIDEE